MISKVFHWKNILWILIISWVLTNIKFVIINGTILQIIMISILSIISLYIMHKIKSFSIFLHDIFRPHQKVDEFEDPNYEPLDNLPK